MNLTNADVADILALLDSLPYDELDIQTPRFRLTLRRAADGGWTQESQLSGRANGGATGHPTGDLTGADAPTPRIERGDCANAPNPAAGGDSGGGPDAAGGRSAAAVGDGAGLVVVAAPLPGTFYRAPRPGAAAFVEVGDVVSADSVVAIVETMKLMNSVHAGTRGRVARICVDNAEPVTQGTALLLIDPEA